ncbi:MAG: CDP-glycerol glycerophosphotransferase family protein, partial [Calditrichia bacterium]|nr:CDP-glycerol glycerophosphotransferase family protein [Calditrichia bacterium]
MIKVLFDLKKEYYFNSLYPLYKELAKDPEYDLWMNIGNDQKRFLGIFLISNKKRVKSELEQKDYKITDQTKGYDLIVCGDALKNPERYDKKAVKVHLDHGVGIKTLRIRNIVKQKEEFYHVFLEGQYWYDYIKTLGWQDKAKFYTDTGIPKLDPFFWENYYNNEELIKKMGIDPGKKTVLFAPSYKPSCIKFLQKKITDLLPDYNLIIKLHPYSWGGKYVSHSQHKVYEKLAAKNSQVFLIPEHDYDIYPYLYLADTMISDTS